VSDVIAMERATIRAPGGSTLVGPVDWSVTTGQRWIVLGPNGSGKTSLLRLAGAERRPTSGTVTVLGHRLGRVDLRSLRGCIGVASSAIDQQLRPTLTAADAVVTARHGALEPWWHEYSEADHRRAQTLLDFVGCAALGPRPLVSLSQGERQRVLLARSLMSEPRLLLLDEPAAGLDLPGREQLVERLEVLAADPGAPTMVLVTHHVEEIPAGMTHGLLLRAGQVVAAGPLRQALSADSMSQAYGLDIELEHRDGRYAARGRRSPLTDGR
jgi:iron complex transport system ATP-binding protein